MWNSPELEITRELSPGERLLWSGQPRGGIRLRAADAFIIPFSLVWCGFAIFWEVMALTVVFEGAGPIGIVFPLFGLPFVLVGLYFVFGRFLVDARVRQRTYYGVTHERIVIVSGLFSRRTRSLNLRTLSEIGLAERPDGSGTITFGPTHFIGQWLSPESWPGAGQYAPPAFDRIDRAKEIYDLIRRAQQATT